MISDPQIAASLGAHRSATGRSVVLLEGDAADAELFKHQLNSAWSGDLHIVVLSSLAEFELRISSLDPDIVFCGLLLPDATGLTVIERAIQCCPAPLIVLTSSSSPELPMAALSHGAQDYLRKGQFSAEDLARSLRHSMARSLAEAQTRRVARELTQINRELDQFAGVIAHDLRSPVRTARLFANRLTAAASIGEDTTVVATALDESLERLELLIKHLLHMASIRDHTICRRAEPLASVIDDVRSQLAAELDEAGASLVCTCTTSISADPKLLRELLRTLTINSLQYRSPDRGPAITVDCQTTADTLQINVTDNGIGVEPRYRERIFGLFERLDSAGPASSVGFGLTLCRQIVELHGGTIAIEDSPTGVGLAVSVRLPTAVSEPQPTHRGAISAETLSTRPSWSQVGHSRPRIH